jgi:hypothetical protein
MISAKSNLGSRNFTDHGCPKDQIQRRRIHYHVFSYATKGSEIGLLMHKQPWIQISELVSLINPNNKSMLRPDPKKDKTILDQFQ